ncbi:unnamed protein product [Dibothriocephalus latus]|uniref:Uncharacterized protein n=1 Tax=Dibothriocephalus latus TaxID=60516 RepID=A0A3P6QJ09_DIBLA|nr:unnamed protein product [Dibothriocephalus latus]
MKLVVPMCREKRKKMKMMVTMDSRRRRKMIVCQAMCILRETSKFKKGCKLHV